MICDISGCSSIRIRVPKLITKLFITIVLEEEFQLIVLSKCTYFVQYTTLKWSALVWLGPAADGSDGLMDVFIKMGKFAEEFKLLDYYTKERFEELRKIVAKTVPDDPDTMEYHAFCESILPLFTHGFYTSLMAFYKRPWFLRTWVIQEFALAPKATFICGHKTISAENLMVVLQMINMTMSGKVIKAAPQDRVMTGLLAAINEINTLQPFFSLRQRHKLRENGRSQGDGLYQILQKVHVSQSVQASQGCDMIYGLLGLVNDKKSLGIQIDYDLPTDVVYTRTARALIQSGKIDLLVLAQHKKHDISLPSWVPDWRSEIRRSFAWISDEEKKPLFSASAGMALELVDDADERALALMGFQVDRLEDIGGPWSGSGVVEPVSRRFPHEAYINFFAQVRQLCLLAKAKGNDVYPSTERRDEAEWRVPVGDIEQDENNEPIRATTSLKKAYERCVAEVELQMQWKAMASLEEYKARAAEIDRMGDQESSWYRIRMQELKSKRPFLSQMGYVGLGPAYTRPGDVIVVLTGASLPFIVRPVERGKFRLLGECYCDGIMDGEIVERRTKEKIVLV
jgi:hypothetical protein